MKIFLGYPSEYRDAAQEIYDFLKSNGDDVWFDQTSLGAGDEWDKERDRAQRDAELVIHLCSAAILQRVGVVNREIKQTLRLVEDQPFGALYVIPMRLEPIILPVELLRFQYIDFFQPSWRSRLGSAVEKRRLQLWPSISPTPEQVVTRDTTTSGFQKIEFKDTTNTYECRGEYICYPEEGLYWTFLNSVVASHALDRYYFVRSEFRWRFSDNIGKEDRGASEWSISTEEFFRQDDSVSLRFYTYISYAGAAHPNHHITTHNFCGEAFGAIEIQHLLGYSIESAKKILAYCEKSISASLEEEEFSEDAFFRHYKEDEDDAWKLLSQFNFDRHGLTFNFSPYDILPYAFGSHEIKVPWSFLCDMLSEEGAAALSNVISRPI